MKCASLYWFSEAEHENGYEVLFGYSFQKKKTNLCYTYLTHYTHDTVYWLACVH